ncbi:MAG: hypothetical protein KJT03_00790 [Verrucomicrobiae bacterium]|nr:hypothetical protein [Verrucomicrobiae bacterium]
MAAFFGMWHGPEGLKSKAKRITWLTEIIYDELTALGVKIITEKKHHFDTLCIDCNKSGFSSSDFVIAEFHKFGINLRKVDQNIIGFSLNETTTIRDVVEFVEIFADLLEKSDPQHEYIQASYFEEI